MAVGRLKHRLPRPRRAPGCWDLAASPARQAEAVSTAAAGRAGWHKSRFVTAAPALGPGAWRAGFRLSGFRGSRGPFVKLKESGRTLAGDVARGGARAARVTAEPDTGRARWRRGRHQIRAGVG
ncbi:uncharacterized protein [Marmota flaviventris]|uniref:uncharacterized protein isoform X1 n=1 Tax=Marmota flaviventris TaxID=93162 RepID=UPI003A8B333A